MYNSRICYLVLAGEGAPVFTPKDGDLVIAVDGGYEKCLKAGVEPAAIVGDFDSLGYVPDGKPIVKLKREKDYTDTMVAIDEGFKRGYRDFVLLCGLGGRFSHSLGNLSALMYITNKGGDGIISDANTEIGVVTTIKEFEPGYYLSLIPVNEKCKVSINGCKYDGQVTIQKDETLGLSNETGKGAWIKRMEGLAYYILEKK